MLMMWSLGPSTLGSNLGQPTLPSSVWWVCPVFLLIVMVRSYEVCREEPFRNQIYRKEPFQKQVCRKEPFRNQAFRKHAELVLSYLGLSPVQCATNQAMRLPQDRFLCWPWRRLDADSIDGCVHTWLARCMLFPI